MTTSARHVLNDLKLTLELLHRDPDNAEWRIHWVAAIALARSVGYVLWNVDVRDGRADRSAARKLFDEWKVRENKEHEIFRDFIELERNSVLKEYESSVYPENEIWLLAGEEAFEERFLLGSNLFRPIEFGLYEGEDARYVIHLAIDWWDKQLCRLEDRQT